MKTRAASIGKIETLPFRVASEFSRKIAEGGL
jgi:hypothetical protein